MPGGEVINLTFRGYNYTDRYIDGYSVDGIGGGHLFVSGPLSGGGGHVCCFRYVPGMTVGTVKVRWQTSACKYATKSEFSDDVFQRIHHFYREAEVKVDAGIHTRPEYFEVHFYPGGHVEAAITASESLPRVRLSKNRERRQDYQRCPDDKKPVDPNDKNQPLD